MKDLTQVVKHPLSTEKSIRLMEAQNKLIFVVDKQANKQEVKEAVQLLFNVKVVSVRTLITPAGKKRAYVQFHQDTPAIEVATKLGLM